MCPYIRNLNPGRSRLARHDPGRPMDDAQKHFVIRYLIARARLRRGRGIPSMTALEHELAHGYELLAGGVLVHPDANPPITADDQDPDFFHAIIEGDDGAIPDTN